jgi:two-component system, OmpR family, sensor kinase
MVLAFAYVLLTVIIALTIPLAINLRGRAVAELKTQVLVNVQTIAGTIGYENLVSGPVLNRTVQSYSSQLGGRVLVMDSAGNVLADSDGTAIGKNYNDGARPEITAALAGHATSIIRYSYDLNADVMFAAAPIFDAGTLAGAVRVTKNVQFVEDAVRTVTIGLVVVGAGVLLAGLLIAYALAGGLSRPLTALAGAARRLGDGDLSARAEEVKGATEIQDLGHSFNDMADRVERTVLSQREFVANASHQLRTPLTGMKLRLESAANQTQDPNMKRQLLAADREVDRLAEIVNRLLLMAKQIEEGEPIRVDLGASVTSAVERWEERAGRQGAVLSADNPTGSAQAHPADVDQILDNLIENAITYAPGPIELETGATNGHAFLAVRDHGPGIPDTEKAHVTERFYRGKGTPKGGSGLGLAIARGLAEKWGGTLSVESPTDGGGGTRIEVELRSTPALV